jgi:hypothetical protein
MSPATKKPPETILYLGDLERRLPVTEKVCGRCHAFFISRARHTDCALCREEQGWDPDARRGGGRR